MEAILQSLLADSQGLLAYLTVFGILLACGLGVPLPEDLSLILGGYLAHQGAANLPAMMAVGFFGILVGDSMIYAIGRRVGLSPSKGGLIGRIVTPEKRALVAHMFERHGRKVVMIARFMPGLRAVTYFTAGSVRMPYLQFIFWDGIAALASAPFFVWLGFRFGDEMDALIAKVKEGQMAAISALVLLGVAFFAYRFIRNRRRRSVAALLQRNASQPGTLTDASAAEPSSVPFAPNEGALEAPGVNGVARPPQPAPASLPLEEPSVRPSGPPKESTKKNGVLPPRDLRAD